jgi:hypothetical protein
VTQLAILKRPPSEKSTLAQSLNESHNNNSERKVICPFRIICLPACISGVRPQMAFQFRSMTHRRNYVFLPVRGVGGRGGGGKRTLCAHHKSRGDFLFVLFALSLQNSLLLIYYVYLCVRAARVLLLRDPKQTLRLDRERETLFL